MMNRQALIDDLIRDEDDRPFPYTDPGGAITIGVGRNLTANGLYPGESMLLLNHDIDRVLDDCYHWDWFGRLDEVRQRAVANWRFNLGLTRALTFKKFLEAMADRNYQKASEELLDSVWAAQVGGRAIRIARMIREGK